MRRRLVWMLAAGLSVGLIAAGCGGDDDDDGGDTTTQQALTKAEFIAQAGAICKQGDKEITQAFNQLSTADQAKRDQVVTDTVVPNIQKQIDDIRSLGAPAGDEDQVNAILDAAQSGLDQVKADPNVIANEAANPFAEADKLAKDYGLTEC